MKEQELIKLLEKSGGVMSTKELRMVGWNYYQLNKMMQKGVIERVKRGVYRLSNGEVDEYTEMLKIVPQGVVCLFSAALLHELTTFLPQEHQISIPKKQKVVLPDYPPIKLYYWHSHQYKMGIKKMDISKNAIPIYDREKTVCDFVKFRNKVGIDSMKEVLKNYLDSKNRNISKLVEYAKELKIYSVMDKYLEVLV